MNDFSDRPFVAGSVVGLRAFCVDSLGRLTGVAHRSVWTPGVNEAQCFADPFSSQGAAMARLNQQMQAMLQRYQIGGVIRSAPHEQHVHTAPRYIGGGYGPAGRPAGGGYVAAEDPGQPQDRKSKGWKKRAAEAESERQAEAERKRAEDAERAREERERKWAEHRLLGLNCTCGFYAYFDGGNDYLTQTVWATSDRPSQRTAGIVEGFGKVVVGSRGFRAEKARVLALIIPEATTAANELRDAKLRRNYPEVSIFPDEAAAVRAHPLTDPEPVTPDEADFWTRKAT